MELITYYAVFATIIIGYYKTDYIRRLPRSYSDIYRYPIKQQFLDTCRKELITLISMGIWRLVNKESADIILHLVKDLTGSEQAEGTVGDCCQF
jgi:hypothetical protein